MSTPPLPDRWEDEPWPLDDPVPAPSLRPTNWSDTHADPPQVADLADEAWQRAVDRGISMERALAELQRERDGRSSMRVTFSGVDISKFVASIRISQDLVADFQRSWLDTQKVLGSTTSTLDDLYQRIQADAAKIRGQRIESEVKAAPIVPSWQWDACLEVDQ